MLRAEEKGVSKVQCQNTWEFIDLGIILNGISKFKDRTNELKISNRLQNEEIRSDNIYSTFIGEVTMGDKYEAMQVGAQGPNARAHGMTFTQKWEASKDKYDLMRLSEELRLLKTEMKNLAETVENFSELQIIAVAETEANNGDGPKVLSLMSKVGKWTLGVAEKIGVEIAASMIKDNYLK